MVSVWGQRPVDRRSDLPQALDWSEAAARAGGSTAALLMVLRSRVASFLVHGETDGAVRAAEDGLAIARARQDAWWCCHFLAWSAAAHTMAGERATAIARAAEGRDIALREGDLTQLLRTSHVLLGATGADPAVDGAYPTEDELVPLARRIGDAHAEGLLLVGGAVRSVVGGDVDGAARHLRESLALGHRSGLWYLEELSLLALVVVATAGGRPEEAARLHGALGGVLGALERAIAPEAMQLYRFAVDGAAAALGEEAFDRAVAWGRLIDWDGATALGTRICDGLVDDDRRDGASGDAMLSSRQSEVLTLLARGRTNKEIAAELGLRPKTVTNHTGRLYALLGVRNRTEAVAAGRRLGLLGDDD